MPDRAALGLAVGIPCDFEKIMTPCANYYPIACQMEMPPDAGSEGLAEMKNFCIQHCDPVTPCVNKRARVRRLCASVAPIFASLKHFTN